MSECVCGGWDGQSLVNDAFTHVHKIMFRSSLSSSYRTERVIGGAWPYYRLQLYREWLQPCAFLLPSECLRLYGRLHHNMTLSFSSERPPLIFISHREVLLTGKLPPTVGGNGGGLIWSVWSCVHMERLLCHSKSGSFCEGGAKREGTGNSQEQNTQLFTTFLLRRLSPLNNRMSPSRSRQWGDFAQVKLILGQIFWCNTMIAL